MIVRNTTKVVGFLLYHVREEGSDTGSGAYYYILISRQEEETTILVVLLCILILCVG
jgi:hypothetical protein